MYKNIVVIDAGHGGTDSGACRENWGLKRKNDLTLSIVLGAKNILMRTRIMLFIITRTTDTLSIADSKKSISK